MRNYRIGVDGGGTKTRAVLLDENLQIIGEGVSGSSNLYAVGLEKAAQNILQSADFALAQASISRQEIAGWGLGLGGVCSAIESARIESALRGFLGENVPIAAREDVVAAHRGAFDWSRAGASQIVCIAGTGANCFGRNPDGKTAKSDGIGPLLGDRGSGYRIGEAALRFYGKCADGITPHSDFSRAIPAHFGAKNLDSLVEIVYAPDFERSRVASLVPLVLEFSKEDSNARKILEEAGRELAQTARAVLGQLSTKNEGNLKTKAEIALIGGVLSGASLVRESFQQSLGEAAELVEARYESAIGAALLL